MTLKVKVSECDCKKCSSMCHAPCCGTSDDMEKLMDAGYGNSLMYDDLPGGAIMLKPALKGFEGKRSPWETSSTEGCTFWKNGKCELHESGLKPTQGKLALHNLKDEERKEIVEFIEESWGDEKKSKKVIDRWKKLNNWDPINE